MPRTSIRVTALFAGLASLALAAQAVAYRDVRMTIYNSSPQPVSVRWWDTDRDIFSEAPPQETVVPPGDKRITTVAITGSTDVLSRWDLIALVGTRWKRNPWEGYRYITACVAGRNPSFGSPRFAAGPDWAFDNASGGNSPYKKCSEDTSSGAFDTTLYPERPPYPAINIDGVSGEVRRYADSKKYIEFRVYIQGVPAVPNAPIQTTVSGPGRVASTPAGAATCSAGTCEGAAPEGSEVTAHASPAPGAYLTGWGGACSGSDDDCRFTAQPWPPSIYPFFRPGTDPVPLSATFAPIPPKTLEVGFPGSGAGTVTSDPVGLSCAAPQPAGTTCTSAFPMGSSVTLLAAPASGSSFAGWTGPCAGSGDTCTVTLASPTAVAARFTPDPAPAPDPAPDPAPAPDPSPRVQPMVVVPEPGPNPPDPGQRDIARSKPVISGLAVTRARFAPHRGTVVRYRLSENAAVTMTFTPRGSSRPAYTYRIRPGRAGADSGANSVRIVGRVRNRDVAAGRWTMRIIARNAKGAGRPVARTLTVLRGPG